MNIRFPPQSIDIIIQVIAKHLYLGIIKSKINISYQYFGRYISIFRTHLTVYSIICLKLLAYIRLTKVNQRNIILMYGNLQYII